MIKYRKVFDDQEDLDRIQRSLAESGFDVDYTGCDHLWRSHSDEYCASWLFLPETDAELKEIIVDKLIELVEKGQYKTED